MCTFHWSSESNFDVSLDDIEFRIQDIKCTDMCSVLMDIRLIAIPLVYRFPKCSEMGETFAEQI